MRKPQSLLLGCLALLCISRAPAQFAETHGWTFLGGNLVANWSFENLTTEICGPVNSMAYGSLTECRLKSTDARTANYVLRARMQNQGPTTPISWAVSQTSEHLLAKPGAAYRFEVQYQVDWTEKMTTARVVVGFLDGEKNPLIPFAEGPRYFDLDSTDVTAWSTYAFTFNTPPQAQYLFFHLVQVDNDGAAGAGDEYHFDNVVIREAAAPSAVLESRSYLDAVGRVDHSIFADGTRDIVSKSSYDAFGRLKEAFLPFTVSGFVFSDITVSALNLSGELPVDFPTLQQAYTALSQAAASMPASALPPEIHVYIITHADEFAPMDSQSATLEPLVSVDGQTIPLVLNGTVYGSLQYLDLKTRRSGTSAGHRTRGPFTGDVAVALTDQYPGENNLSSQLEYPAPGVSRTHQSSLPGNLYGPSAHFQKSGSALIRSTAFPSDPEAGGNPDPFQADFRYSWSRDPQGRYSAQVMNAEGQVVRSGTSTVAAPAGDSDWFVGENSYDAFSRLDTTRTPQNLFTAFAYDGMSRLARSDDPDRGITEYLYDAPGRPRFSRSAHGLANGYFIAIRYDLAGRFLGRGKVDQPAAYTQANAENAAFPTLFFIDQGVLYDALEPLRFAEATGVTLSGLGFVPPVRNAQGLVVASYHRNLETQAPGVTQPQDKLVASFNSYDSLGRLTDKWQYLGPAPAGSKWHKIQYTYDIQDRLHSVAVYDDALGISLASFSKYIYNAKGTVEAVQDETGQPVAAYTYDFQNRLTEVNLLSKVKVGFTYDIQGKTRSLEAVAEGFPNPHVFSEYLGYEDKPYAGMTDSLASARKRFDGGISSLVRKFSTAAPNPVEWWQYDYDFTGRMEGSGKHLPQGVALKPDGSLHSALTFQATAALARDYQYNSDGAITSQSDGTTAYAYNYVDGTHQLDHVTPNLPGRTTSTPGNFEYDEIGRLTQDTGRGTGIRYSVADMPVELERNGKTYYQFYDAGNNRVADLEETTPGNVLARKIYVYEAGLKVLKEIVHREAGHPDSAVDIQKNHHYGQSGLVAVSHRGQGEKHILLKDHQGSVMGVVSGSTPTITKEQGYLPFGSIEPRVVPGAENVPSEAWTGKEYEAALGLYNFGLRWMDPELAIWMTPDPAGQFANPYSYGGDPVNFVDPDGRFIIEAAFFNAFKRKSIGEGIKSFAADVTLNTVGTLGPVTEMWSAGFASIASSAAAARFLTGNGDFESIWKPMAVSHWAPIASRTNDINNGLLAIEDHNFSGALNEVANTGHHSGGTGNSTLMYDINRGFSNNQKAEYIGIMRGGQSRQALVWSFPDWKGDPGSAATDRGNIQLMKGYYSNSDKEWRKLVLRHEFNHTVQEMQFGFGYMQVLGSRKRDRPDGTGVDCASKYWGFSCEDVRAAYDSYGNFSNMNLVELHAELNANAGTAAEYYFDAPDY